MKQSEVKIGKVYQVKVSGVLKPVRVEARLLDNYGLVRYYGTVLTTGRKITLTVGRMRKELPGFQNPDVAWLYQDGKSKEGE